MSVSCQVRFLGGGVCGTLAFSLLRDFVYTDEDSAKSHQPTATKHAGLHREGTGETPFLCFVKGILISLAD